MVEYVNLHFTASATAVGPLPLYRGRPPSGFSSMHLDGLGWCAMMLNPCRNAVQKAYCFLAQSATSAFDGQRQDCNGRIATNENTSLAFCALRADH